MAIAANFDDLQQLLSAAGATVALDTLASWTPDQCDEASEWARAQADASAKDKPGHHTSVRWPDHVAQAHHDECADAGISTTEPAPDPHTATTVRCRQCGSKATWKGALTPDMITRTFTRGVDAQSGLPNCPKCGQETELVEHVPIEQAMETAAAHLPADRVERRQPSIPGLLPPFDHVSALSSILEQRAVVRRAQAIADSKHKDAAKAKKGADEEQAKLSTLEDDYSQRLDEITLEASMSPEDRRARGCSFEALTGTPCVLCRNPTEGITPAYNGNPGHLVAAAHVAARSEDLTPAALVAVVESVAHLVLELDAVSMWSSEDMQAVTAWLEVPSMAPRPEILGRAHVIGAVGGKCGACGALLHPLAEARGLERWTPGQLVGTDCDGGPAKAEPAHKVRKRHATPAAAAKAKQKHQETERGKGKRLAKRAGITPVEKSRSAAPKHAAPRARDIANPRSAVRRSLAKGRRR